MIILSFNDGTLVNLITPERGNNDDFASQHICIKHIEQLLVLMRSTEHRKLHIRNFQKKKQTKRPIF